MRLRTCLMILALLAAPARAQDCEDAADQASLNACADQAYWTADAELNARYAEIMARLADDAPARGLLVAAQRDWIGFRDGECAFAASAVTGGSIYPMVLSFCLAEKTETRSADLGAYLACEEGDLSCPVPGAP